MDGRSTVIEAIFEFQSRNRGIGKTTMDQGQIHDLQYFANFSSHIQKFENRLDDIT